MEKFRITDCGTLEIRLLNDRILFSTTPDYLEEIADLSKEKALLIAEKICEWASDVPDEPPTDTCNIPHVVVAKRTFF